MVSRKVGYSQLETIFIIVCILVLLGMILFLNVVFVHAQAPTPTTTPTPYPIINTPVPQATNVYFPTSTGQPGCPPDGYIYQNCGDCANTDIGYATSVFETSGVSTSTPAVTPTPAVTSSVENDHLFFYLLPNELITHQDNYNGNSYVVGGYTSNGSRCPNDALWLGGVLTAETRNVVAYGSPWQRNFFRVARNTGGFQDMYSPWFNDTANHSMTIVYYSPDANITGISEFITNNDSVAAQASDGTSDFHVSSKYVMAGADFWAIGADVYTTHNNILCYGKEGQEVTPTPEPTKCDVKDLLVESSTGVINPEGLIGLDANPGILDTRENELTSSAFIKVDRGNVKRIDIVGGGTDWIGGNNLIRFYDQTGQVEYSCSTSSGDVICTNHGTSFAGSWMPGYIGIEFLATNPEAISKIELWTAGYGYMSIDDIFMDGCYQPECLIIPSTSMLGADMPYIDPVEYCYQPMDVLNGLINDAYVWARGKAEVLGINVSGTPESIALFRSISLCVRWVHTGTLTILGFVLYTGIFITIPTIMFLYYNIMALIGYRNGG